MILNELFTDDINMKSLYVSRRVLNREAIRDWARENGFTTTLPGEDFHVTIAFCKKKFDWTRTSPDDAVIYIAPDHQRHLKVFDGGATVIHFINDQLATRWQEFITLGASNSYPSYKAHITVTYRGKPKTALAYPGELVLGPEIWQEVNLDWKSEMVEVPLLN